DVAGTGCRHCRIAYWKLAPGGGYRGRMNFNRLSEYLEGMERRLRALALTRGAAITAAAALCCTVVGVLIANYLGFSAAGILWGRLLLFFGLVVALSAGLALPLLRLNRRKAAH